MNKTAIRNFAVRARVMLLDAVKQAAFEYGISGERTADPELNAVNGRPLTAEERSERRELIRKIGQNGYEETMEAVAYTWFNRFAALRYMEVNGFLPSRVRVFSNESGAFAPQILTEAMTVELEGLDRQRVADMMERQDNEGLYRYLLIAQCNALNEALPGMFERISNETELLFPAGLLKSDSVIAHMVQDIPEGDWTDAVQVIGWLYQFYISVRHEEVVDPIHGKEIAKEDIPAATQLFTTDWVVRYLVDNSIGRYWIERHPESRLTDKLEFFVRPKHGTVNVVDQKVAPEELSFLDPCMGSGHILVYAFDVLMEIYRECGYSDRDAAASIVQRNLFGLDVDERAAQLAYFAVMMKARMYDRRFLTRGIQPNIYSPGEYEEGQEFGSLIQVPEPEPEPRRKNGISMFGYEEKRAQDRWNFRRLLARKYTAVVTNPPYLNKYNPMLKRIMMDEYKDYSGDMFSAFIYRDLQLCEPDGYCGYMTPNVWMFIKTYEKLRVYLIRNKQITTLIQMAKGAFFKEATVDICAFVICNRKREEKGLYIRLEDFKGDMEVQRQKVLEALSSENCKYFFEATENNFSKIPGSPIAYWVGKGFFDAFTKQKISDYADVITGMTIGDNNKYLRLWFEVWRNKIALKCNSMSQVDLQKTVWIPYSKGGERRNWYGNYEYVVNWSKKDNFNRSKTTLQHLYLKEALTWPFITSGDFSARLLPQGFLWEVAGSPCFFKDREDEYYTLGFLCSKVANYILKVINPTINVQAVDIAHTPLIIDNKREVIDIASESISLSCSDWDSFETSWDFKKHPLI